MEAVPTESTTSGLEGPHNIAVAPRKSDYQDLLIPNDAGSSPRYRSVTVSQDEGDEERVLVEHNVSEKTLRAKLTSWYLRNCMIRNALLYAVKLYSCMMYVERSVNDTDPHSASGYGCPENRTDYSDWSCPKYEENATYYAWSLLWVDRSFSSWAHQTCLAVYSIVDAILLCFFSYTGGSVMNHILLHKRLLSEFGLGLPFLVSIFYCRFRNFYVPLFLNCWLALNAAQNVLERDRSSFIPRSKTLSLRKIFIGSGTLCFAVFSGICVIHHLERAAAEPWDFLDCVWYVVVSFGDVRPDDLYGQACVVGIVVIVICLLPVMLDRLTSLLDTQEGEFNPRFAGLNKHIVLCATNLKPTTMIDFLNEFYAHASLQDHRVVFLCPSELDSASKVLLRDPVWFQRVTYLKGSALIDEDLIRASVEDAKGCFILNDRYADNRDAADKHTILRTWAIKRFAPRTRLFVQILKEENKFHVSFAEHLVCDDEIKHALLASNCICPGISTFFTLLLHTLHEQRGSEDWHEMFGKCAGNEMYDIRLGDSKMFRPYCGKTFTHTAFHVHKKYGATLFAVSAAKKGRRILLNPGPTHIMDYDDRGYYIAMSSEEDSHFKVYKEPKQSSVGLLKNRLRHRNDSAITTGSVTFELCTNAVDSEDDEAASEQGMDLLEDTSRTPSYVPGIPPCSSYVGHTTIKCHLLKNPNKNCCLPLRNEACVHRNVNDSAHLHEIQHGAIIVASPVAEAGLYNFILPLRAHHRPECTLKPIILLLKEEPNQGFLMAVRHFPMLYYMIGTINSLDDLLEVGCLHAHSIVVVGFGSHGQTSDEDHMADATTIVDVQNIYRCFPRTTLIVELTYASNMRFMKFNFPPSEIQSESTSVFNTRERANLQKKDHLNYIFSEPFAAGHVFSIDMLDTLLYQAFVKNYMIDLVRLMLGCQQAQGSGYLSSLKVTGDQVGIETYGRLFRRLYSKTCEIPIGLLRKDISEDDCIDASLEKEARDINDIIEARMKTLNMLGTELNAADFQQRPGRSYVIVNPPPEFELKAGDIIYLICPFIANEEQESTDPEMMV